MLAKPRGPLETIVSLPSEWSWANLEGRAGFM